MRGRTSEPRFAFYAVLSVMALLGCALMLWQGIGISSDLLPAFILGALLPFVFRFLLPRYGNPKTSGALETVGVLYIQGAFLFPLLYPLAKISRPFADPALASWDAALGFHWPSFVSLFGPREVAVLQFFYDSFTWQALIILPALWATGRGERAWRFVLGATVAAFACALVFPLVPAQGPTVHYGLTKANYPLLSDFAWQFGPALESLKAGETTVLRPEGLFAMVSVPSYHTVAAALFTWAAWPVRWLRLPILVLNAGMLVATVLNGTHYLVDVVAGGTLAAVVLSLLAYAGRRAKVTAFHAPLPPVHAAGSKEPLSQDF